MEPKALGLAALDPVFAGCLQHIEGAGDIGLDKITGSVNGSVHMAFCRQMHHRIRFVLGKNSV